MIGVGASLNRHTTEHGYIYPEAKYIQLDPKPHVVLGNGRGADVYVQSDAKEGLEALDALLEKRGFKQTGYRTGETLERLSNMYEDRTEFKIEPGTIDPRLRRAARSTRSSPATSGFSSATARARRITMMNT